MIASSHVERLPQYPVCFILFDAFAYSFLDLGLFASRPFASDYLSNRTFHCSFVGRIIISYIRIFLPAVSSSWLDEAPLKIRSHLPLHRIVSHIRSPRS